MCKTYVLLIKPIAFLIFSLPSLLSLLKLPHEGKPVVPGLGIFRIKDFFCYALLSGGDQREDNKKSADKKETKVGDFTFNITS